MDGSTFDRLTRAMGAAYSRRAATALLGAAAVRPLLDPETSEAKKKKKKKVTLCLNGNTIKVPKKKKGSYLNQGATVGACAGACVPTCSGCGGSDGCGGICGCGVNEVCDAGTCRACDVTCDGRAIACGAALTQRLTDGGTIYVCPGQYLGNFTVQSTRLVGAGGGNDPASNTILDAGGSGRVVTIPDNTVVELVGLRITGGKAMSPDFSGGGVLALAGDLRITNCTITRNETDLWGGGVYSAGAFRMTNSTVSQNTAQGRGGISLVGTEPTFITDSVITGNQTAAGNNAGGLYNLRSPLTIVGTEISRNTAGQEGGGIANIEGVMTLDATSRVINNTASSFGGIFNDTGTVTLNGATISGNSAPQCRNVIGC
jgi:hypothetical protein